MANPKQSKVNKAQRRAVAPYNFVPLPEAALTAPTTPGEEGHTHQYGLPDADRYHTNLHSGRIDCELVTRSPLYTRRAVSMAFYNEWAEKMDKLADDPAALQEYAQFFTQGNPEEPVIPGSSIRGMLRSLMEIVTHGHLRWVGKEPTFTFRAVAAQREDPLRDPYQEIIGRFGRNVRAGILERDGQSWKVRVAPTPQERKIAGRHGNYMKVKEKYIPTGAIANFRRFDDQDYQPGWFLIRFSTKKVGQGDVVDQIGDYATSRHSHIGVLVCSGNMLETAKAGQTSPRRSHAIVLAPPRNAPLLEIDQVAIEDYLNGMSDFVNSKLKAWGSPLNKEEEKIKPKLGCLCEGAPIFFVDPQTHGERKIRYFGHTPNFRIPAQLAGAGRAANPLDFAPAHLRQGKTPDLTEAIFGWVEEPEQPLEGQRAGRIFVSDARFAQADDGLWLATEPTWLHTLSTPKPTTFQHYLVQDKTRGHDPDNLSSLAHYGSAPETTQIRGYKHYWTKGSTPDIRASAKELQHKNQLTQVRPVKPGVHFTFTIRFENLSAIELGALLWTLTLPGGGQADYCHRLGMGKPLGMGAVQIAPTLIVDQRPDRYKSLFAGVQWAEPATQADPAEYVTAFEQYMLPSLQSTSASLSQLPRIRTLLTLLQWREGTRNWQNETRYMEIERESKPKDEQNEYKNRPVLPTPEEVAEQYDGQGNRTISAQPFNVALESNQDSAEQAPEQQQSAGNSEFLTGTVVAYGLGRNRSFGYIEYISADGRATQIFVHHKQIAKGSGLLTVGDKVHFTIGAGPNGNQAEQVTRL